MAAPSLPHQPTTKRRDTSPAPQLIIPPHNLNDGQCWHVFTSAVRLLPPHQRIPFAMRVLGRLIDNDSIRPEQLMAACNGALVESTRGGQAVQS
jgi:hypothetical protein